MNTIRFLFALALLLVLFPATHANAAISLDRDQSARATNTSTLTWNHRVGNALDRKLIVGIAVEEGGSGNDEVVSGVTYGGNPLTLAGTAWHTSDTYRQRVEIWYIDDADFPGGASSGSGAPIQVTFNGNVREANAGSISFSGAAAGAPEAVASNTVSNANSITTNITTLTDGAWLIDVVGAGDRVTFSQPGSQNERWQERNSSSGAASSIKAVPSAGATSMVEYPSNQANRMAHVVIAIPEAGAVPPTANPVAEWRLDELAWSGTTNEVVDSTGNGNNGTAINGAATIDAGKICRAGSFDGTNSVQVLNLFNLLRGTASLSFWIKTSQSGTSSTNNWSNPGIAGVEQSGGVDDVFWGWIDPSGHIGISKGNDNNAHSNASINDSYWHHVVLTRDASNGAYKIYIDGSLDNSGTTGSGIVGTSFSNLGKIEDTAAGSSGNFFVGELDEVLVFDAVVSNSQVTTIYNAQLAGKNLDGSDRVCPVQQSCLTDDFNRSTLGSNWSVSNSQGSFGDPRIINNRLRLTDASTNAATAATLQQQFPGAGNKIIVEFDYLAYAGSGADGIAVTLSDASVPPIPGGYGGSLGYANRCGIDGFAGGWLGVGLDEYGNYSNSNECRHGGPGFIRDSVAVRGSGSGTNGYNYLDGSTSSLSPGVDQASGSTPGPEHRYRITVDHLTDPAQAIYTVERKTSPSASWTTLASGDALTNPGQAAVPENWLLSFTGSTGGATNIHEIDNLSVCATHMNPVTSAVNHFRIYHDGNALTCSPENIIIRACLNSDCTQETTDTITATLTPTGWSGGDTVTFNSGDTLQLQHTTAEIATLGISTSSPAALNPTLCYDFSGNPQSCDMQFHDSGFAFDVPDHTSDTIQTVTVKSVQKDAVTQQCKPGFASVTKSVKFWSTYTDPGTGTQFVNIDGTDILTASPGTDFNLNFDANGEAAIDVKYPDAGKITLHAYHEGSGDSAGLVMTGEDTFVAKPAHFTISNITRLSDGTTNPAASSASGSAFIPAGEPFSATVTAVNASGNVTPNFGQESSPEGVKFSNSSGTDTTGLASLVAPTGGINPPIRTPGWEATTSYTSNQLVQFGGNVYQATNSGTSGPTFGAGTVTWSNLGALLDPTNHVFNTTGPFTNGIATGTYKWDEVGIVDFTPRILDADYLGAGDVIGNNSGYVGRFYPATLAVSHNHNPGCATSTPPFTYAGLSSGAKSGQPFIVDGTITAQNTSGNTTQNYIGAFAKLTTSGITAIPLGGSGSLINWSVDPLNFSAGTSNFTAHSEYGFTALGAPQTVYLNVSANDGEASGNEIDATKTVEYRLGRLLVLDAFGPQTTDLEVPLVAQYYDGTNYVDNTIDSCSGIFVSSDVSLTDVSPDTDSLDVAGGETSVSAISPTLSTGLGSITLTAPGIGTSADRNEGTAIATLDLTGFAWLRDDTDGNGSYDNDPFGNATFGSYRGDDRFLFWQETQ